MQRQHLHGILGSDVAEALGKYLRRWLLGDDFTKPRDVFDDDNDVVNLTKSAPKGLLDSRDQQLESVLDSTESSGFTPLQLTATPSDNGASQHQIPIPNIEVSSPSSDCMIVVSDSVASITAPSSANIDICDNTDTSLPPPSSSPAISQTVSSEGSEGNEYETNISSSHHVLDHVAVSMRAISASTSIDTPAPVAHETPAPWVVDMSDVTTTQAEQERNPVMARDVSSTSSHDLYINGHGVVDSSVNVQNDTGAGGLPRGCPAYESLGDLERLHVSWFTLLLQLSQILRFLHPISTARTSLDPKLSISSCSGTRASARLHRCKMMPRRLGCVLAASNSLRNPILCQSSSHGGRRNDGSGGYLPMV
jgi:hypothetical protein